MNSRLKRGVLLYIQTIVQVHQVIQRCIACNSQCRSSSDVTCNIQRAVQCCTARYHQTVSYGEFRLEQGIHRYVQAIIHTNIAVHLKRAVQFSRSLN